MSRFFHHLPDSFLHHNFSRRHSLCQHVWCYCCLFFANVYTASIVPGVTIIVGGNIFPCDLCCVTGHITLISLHCTHSDARIFPRLFIISCTTIILCSDDFRNKKITRCSDVAFRSGVCVTDCLNNSRLLCNLTSYFLVSMSCLAITCLAAVSLLSTTFFCSFRPSVSFLFPPRSCTSGRPFIFSPTCVTICLVVLLG